jgi:hypothetical protein
VRKTIALCVIATALVLVARVSTFAQELTSRHYGTLEGQHTERSENVRLPENQEETVEAERPTVQKDSAYVSRPSSTKARTSPEAVKPSGKKNDEDAVSFNFLYYIIQRFKSSDIIED